jgi:recombination protein RecT
MAGSNEVAVVREQLTKMQTELATALPAHIPVERFNRVVMTAVQGNPKLLECNRKSLFNSCMKAAQDGLLPDGREGAIVPYKADAQWLPMIGGLRKKARNSGEIATWDVHAVYENDTFDFELGDNPFIRHKPTLNEKGKLIAVYSIATLKSGEISRDVMSVHDVEAVRTKSRGTNTPWADPVFYPEMAKKTVAKRHSKVLPTSTDLDDLLRRDDVLYDLEGSSDKSPAPKRRGLNERLGDLVGDDAADGDDGKIIDGEVVEETKEDDASLAQKARAEGLEAGSKGMTRKAMPAPYRSDETLSKEWLAGFEEGAKA